MKWVIELGLPVNYCPSCGARMSNTDDTMEDIVEYIGGKGK